MGLRVLHISTEKDFRGGERQLLCLHEALSAKGIKSAILCPQYGGVALKRPAGSLPILPTKGFSYSGAKRVKRILKQGAFDILHCHDATALTIGTIIGQLKRLPVVVTRRVAYPIASGCVNRFLYGRSAHIIAISSVVEKECRRIAPQASINIVPDGVFPQPFSLSRAESRRLLDVPAGAFVIGSVGFFSAEKNLPLLLTLADRLEITHPEAWTVCVGPMSHSNKRDVMRRRNMLAPGYLDEAYRYYAAFDLYVSASVSEGLGSSLLDAVVLDIPSVAIDSGGARDIFPPRSPSLFSRNDEAGLIRGVMDRIDRYSAAAAEARLLGENARRNFSVENMVESTLAVYRRVLGPRR